MVQAVDPWSQVIRFLDLESVESLGMVSKYFRNIVCDSSIERLKELKAKYPLVTCHGEGRKQVVAMTRVVCHRFRRLLPNISVQNRLWADFCNFERWIPSVDVALSDDMKKLDPRFVLRLTKSGLIQDPLACLRSHLAKIKENSHVEYIPTCTLGWPVVHSLKHLVESLPKQVLREVLSRLSSDEQYKLVHLLYPLRLSMRFWVSVGLKLSLRNSKGDTLSHLVASHLHWLKRRTFLGMSSALGPAAFIDPTCAINCFKEYEILDLVSEFSVMQIKITKPEISAIAGGVRRVKAKFRSRDDPLAVAADCVHLTAKMQRIAKRSYQDEKFFLELQEPFQMDLAQDILSVNEEMASKDLLLLSILGKENESRLLVSKSKHMFGPNERSRLKAVFRKPLTHKRNGSGVALTVANRDMKSWSFEVRRSIRA